MKKMILFLAMLASFNAAFGLMMAKRLCPEGKQVCHNSGHAILNPDGVVTFSDDHICVDNGKCTKLLPVYYKQRNQIPSRDLEG